MSIEQELKRINQWQINHEEADQLEFEAMKAQHALDHSELKEMITKLAEKLDPLDKFFGNMTFSKTLLMWILAIMGSFIGVIIGIIQIIKMLR